ncbi:hypothetical protein Q8F55_007594 [Vanrija albida]|uniref:VWFA domain-containing protein n=1 Tax=Vanrija albida TaxID=181172 RepID=A0ABR3PTY5_9TREE
MTQHVRFSPDDITSSYGLIKRLRDLRTTDQQYTAVNYYVRNKLDKGRDINLIEEKLCGIEEKCKVYGHIQDKTGEAFVRVRREHNLRPSAYFAGVEAAAARRRQMEPVTRVESHSNGGAPPPYPYAVTMPIQDVYPYAPAAPAGAGWPIDMSPPAASPPLQSPPAPPAPQVAPLEKRESIPGVPSSLLPPLSPTRVAEEDDPLSRIADYNTVFLVDDSEAMTPARWEQARAAVMSVVAKIRPYAAVDIAFVNNEVTGDGLVSVEEVETLFEVVQPEGSTPTAERISAMLSAYMTALEAVPDSKALNLIVLSGWEAPTDGIKDALAATARQLDEGGFPVSRVYLQMVQIGNDLDAVMALMRFEQALGERYALMLDTNTYDAKEVAGEKALRILLRRVGRGRRVGVA